MVLVGLGSWGLLFPSSPEAPAPLAMEAPEDEETSAPAYVPDVFGMAVGDARTALTQAGIGEGSVTNTTVAYAAPKDTVVDQQPDPGSLITSNTEVSLTLSKGAVMPELTGKAQKEAEDALGDIGAVAETAEVVTAKEPPGTVVGTDPGKGKPITGTVRLKVASAGDAAYLTQLEPVDQTSYDSREDATANGKTYAQSITLDPYRDDPAVADYAISKRGVYLLAEVTVTDDGDRGVAEVTVTGDGKQLARHTVEPGKTVDLKVPVGGLIRLAITATTKDEDEAPTVILGNARITGTARQIDSLLSSGSS